MFEEYQKLLAKFVSFKSISTNPKYVAEIEKAILWLKKLLTENDFKTEIWKRKTTNPVIFASHTTNYSLPTLLIYGHYDVQPADKKEGWKSDPFILRADKTKLYARGVVDNKGQILVHLCTVFELIKKNNLKYNVKFLIEGNEETSNPDLPKLMRKNQKKLSCDILMVSDGELTNNKPTIEVSLRGGFNCTLVYKTAKNNLHSGIFGGAVPNAGAEMVKFLAKLFGSDNSIKYKSFYSSVDEIAPSALSNNKTLTKEAGDIAALAGVKSLLGQKGIDFYTQTGLVPTIQITGIKVGYIDHGYANIVPAAAEARLNFRIVASQKAKKVASDFQKFVARNTPKYVDYKLSFSGFHNPIKVNTENPYVLEAEKLLQKIYETSVNRKNVGGAIPFVTDVKDILESDTLLVPLANEDCNMHGAEENFDINLAKKALKFSQEFLKNS